MASFVFRGVAAARRDLALVGLEMANAVERSLRIEAEYIMTRSKRIVPFDQGPLRASGHVKKPERRGRDVSVTMAYGGTAAPYALIQHENPDFQHSAGKTWKYLEKPMKEALPGMDRRIARSVAETV